MKYIPHEYQAIAGSHILKHNYCGLFLDMGLGKTVVTLTAIQDLKYDRMEVDKVLVIAPKKVAEDTWTREAAKWDHLKHLRVAKVLGSVNQRLKGLEADADIYIINRENVTWLVDYYGLAWPFDMVVIDELSSFKNHTSKRFKSLRKVRPFMKRVVGLTGTPAPNGYEDLWAQVYLLDRGKRLGKTITSYRQTYFHGIMMPAGFELYSLRAGMDEVIGNKIKDICISMKARDYLKLKEPLMIQVPVVLGPKERGQYKTMEREAILSIDDTDITALSAAAVTTKLLQLANGAVYDEDRNVLELHKQKLDRLQELVEEAKGNPVLVFYSFRHDIDRIKEALGPDVRELETAEDIADWNAKKIKVLLAHPASAGHGLNLQDGGNNIIWFGLPWSLELYQQANARLHRQGQASGVIIHHLTTEGTADEEVYKALQLKDFRQEELLKTLKSKL